MKFKTFLLDGRKDFPYMYYCDSKDKKTTKICFSWRTWSLWLWL